SPRHARSPTFGAGPSGMHLALLLPDRPGERYPHAEWTRHTGPWPPMVARVRAMGDHWYDELDGLGLAAAIRGGDGAAAAGGGVAMGRIEAGDPGVGAVVATRFDEARAEAAGPRRNGPFAGVPYLVKSLGGEVAGLPTSRGSRLFADDVATADSLAVARARAA